MKLEKTASGSKKITISRKEWQSIGVKAGWVKTAQPAPQQQQQAQPQQEQFPNAPVTKALGDYLTQLGGKLGPGGEFSKEVQLLMQDGRTASTVQALAGQLKAVLNTIEQSAG